MKVAVDPGHGMSNRQPGSYDPGGTHDEAGFRFEEAEIALRYAQALREALRSRGSAVFLTREDARANGVEVLYRGEASRPLAQALLGAIAAVAPLRNRGIKPRDDLAVLRFPGPAALVELGFIGNDADRAVLINPARRQAICEAIADAALAHGPAGAGRGAAATQPGPRGAAKRGPTRRSRGA